MGLVIVSIALLLGFGSFLVREWRLERQALVEQRTTIASVMAANVSAPVIFNDRATAHEVLRASRGVADLRSAILFDGARRPFAQFGLSDAVRPAGVAAPAWRFTHESLEVRVPVRMDGEPVGELVLVSSLEGLHRTFLSHLIFAGLVFLAVGGVAARAAIGLARRVIRPVDDLSAAMQGVRESGDFARPVEPGQDTELARLAFEFNALLAELARRNAALVAARDQAETANKLKTEFLANMSHELRTPLNAVIGLTPLLAAEPLTVTQRDYLLVIERSADNLLQILNDVLDTAKLESGRLVLEDVAFDLRKLTEESCAIFRSLAEGKGLRFELDVSPELAPAYRGDPLRLKQILTNLVSNAVKFTEAGAVRVSLHRDPEELETLVLVVADTGMGIADDKAPSLFDKFVQADLSTTRKFGGTGLGLSICRELVELMGGRIDVESRLGRGAVFTARFALRPVAPGPAVPTIEGVTFGPAPGQASCADLEMVS